MTAFALTQRRRTGTALIVIGGLLLALSAIMLVGLGPAAASHDNPSTIDEPDDDDCFVIVQSTHNATHEFSEGGADFSVQIVFNDTNKTFTWTVLAPAGGEVSGAYKAGGNDWYAFGPGGAGTTSPIQNNGHQDVAISQYKICGATAPEVEDTTTTTVADTTTTTVAGPDDTTTTTVAGPDDPELPDTGPGELLALLAGGLGLTFIGSGSLVIAGDRRRAL
jgi:hypothetical protein